MAKFFLSSTLVQRLSVLAGAVLLGAVCTHWALQLRPGNAIVPEQLPVLGPPPVVQDAASLHLFGVDGGTVNAVAAVPPPNLRLIGVIAGPAGTAAVAIINIDGKATPVRRGDLIGPGSVLKDIQRDRVVVETGGVSADILLGATTDGMAAGVQGQAPMLPVAGAASMPGMPGMAARGSPLPVTVPALRLDVQSLGPNHLGFSRGELSRALADPKLAGAMGRASAKPGSGLLLEEVPAGSLSDRLGLRAGDVLRSANGQALAVLTDLPRLYQEFASASAVRLEILRAGQPATLQYTLRP